MKSESLSVSKQERLLRRLVFWLGLWGWLCKDA